MADPFAILANSQLNVPALLNTYQNARQSRLQEMLLHRQIAREDKRDEQEAKLNKGMMSVFSRPGAKAATPGGGDPSTAAFDRRLDPSYEEPNPALAGAPKQLVRPSQLPPRTDGVQINQEALQAIYDDPEMDYATKKQIQDMVYQADKKQLEQITQRGEAMMRATMAIGQTPQAQWGAELQKWTPFLEAHGLTREQIAQADLTPAGLKRYYAQGADLKDLVKQTQPDRRAVDGFVLDFNNLDKGPEWTSPMPEIKTGPNGEMIPLYRPGMGGGATDGFSAGAPANADALRAQAAEAIRQGADPAKVNQRLQQMLQGGASPSGSPTFR